MKKYTEQERLEYARNTKPDWPENVIHSEIGIRMSIGKDGFGFVRQEDGTLLKMPHRGNVKIGKGVEIGAFTCIDRAVEGSTEIGDGTKIDNLVHIAHGVKIGRHCLIVAGAIIGGSCEIGDRVYIGIGAMIRNKIKIGDDAVIGMGAVVVKDVEPGQTVIGNPARPLDKLV